LLNKWTEDDDAEEEEEEDEPEEGYDIVLKEHEKYERESSNDLYSHRNLNRQLERDDDAAELANYFKERYSRGSFW